MPTIPTRKPPCPSYILRLMTRGKDNRTAPRAPHSPIPIAAPAPESTHIERREATSKQRLPHVEGSRMLKLLACITFPERTYIILQNKLGLSEMP